MKTKLTLALVLFATVAIAAVVPNWKRPAVNLQWDYSTQEQTNIIAFKIYQGVAPRVYTNVYSALPSARSLQVTNLVGGTTYYWAATAVGADGLESEYSNEATNTTPTKWTPPGRLDAVNIQLP